MIVSAAIHTCITVIVIICAVSLDAALSWEAYNATFGGGVLASAVGILFPAAAAVAGSRRKVSSIALAAALTAIGIAGNCMALTGRFTRCTTGEAPLLAALESARENAERAEAAAAKADAAAVAESSTGQGPRYNALKAAADRAHAAADEARLRVEESVRKLAAAKANIPPHLAAIRFFLPDHEREAVAALNIIIASLVSVIGPVLASSLGWKPARAKETPRPAPAEPESAKRRVIRRAAAARAKETPRPAPAVRKPRRSPAAGAKSRRWLERASATAVQMTLPGFAV